MVQRPQTGRPEGCGSLGAGGKGVHAASRPRMPCLHCLRRENERAWAALGTEDRIRKKERNTVRQALRCHVEDI